MNHETPGAPALASRPHFPHVLFLIRSLNRGGAERQLLELVRELARRGFPVTLCTFYDGGTLADEARSIPGAEIVSLGKRSRWDLPRLVWQFGRAVQHAQPVVIHGYMPVANELSLLMASIFRRKCIFGLRASNVDFSCYGRVAKAAFSFGALCSRFADATIVNSEAGRTFHELNGYDARRTYVIANGIDTTHFSPDASAREVVRREWNVAANERVVAVVARLDPMKDHATFIAAAALVVRTHPTARFVCIGEGSPTYQRQLTNTAAALGVQVHWTGGQGNMARLYNGLDILVLSSAFGEGFPNAVGEAMATGKPCVVTDVGDAAAVVGQTGIVVPPRDPQGLAAGIVRLLDASNEALQSMGSAARTRIQNNFSIAALANSTERVLLEIARDSAARTPRTLSRFF